MFENESPRPTVVAAGGALAGLAVVTAVALSVGFTLEETLEGNKGLGRVHYVLVTGVLGATLAVATREKLRVSAVVGALALMGWVATRSAGGGATSLTVLNVQLTGLAVLVLFAASLEYAVNYPETAREVFTPEAVRVGVVVALLHAGVVHAFRAALGFTVLNPIMYFSNVVVMAWEFAGTLAVGFVVGVLAKRYRLVTPVLVVGGSLVWAAYATWKMVPPSGPSVALVGHPITVYVWGWFVPFTLAISSGLVEKAVRGR